MRQYIQNKLGIILSFLKMIVILFGLFFTNNQLYTINQQENIFIVKNIFIIGNNKLSEKKILEYVSIKVNQRMSIGEINNKILISTARMKDSGLFIFTDINYELMENDTLDIHISLAENIVFLEMIALPAGGLTRFSSISDKAPDFGFIVGTNDQALYFRFPYLGGTPINVSSTFGHQVKVFDYYKSNSYDYENISERISIETSIAPWLKIKSPSIFQYNIKGQPGLTTNTYDISSGGAVLLDFSSYKEVYMIGMDFTTHLMRGIREFPYTLSENFINLYFKPFLWEELIIRGRYRVVDGATIPDYQLGNISGEYQVRGKVKNYYYGTKTIVFNIENWFRNIYTIPVKISTINFSILTFNDFGSAFINNKSMNKKRWNISSGAGIEMNMSNPVNITIEMGFGYEYFLRSGGSFYVKIGKKFYKGNFYE